MLTKQQQLEVINELAEFYEVRDVYFSKGTLYVINAYDIPYVEDYLAAEDKYFRYQYVEEDAYV